MESISIVSLIHNEKNISGHFQRVPNIRMYHWRRWRYDQYDIWQYTSIRVWQNVSYSITIMNHSWGKRGGWCVSMCVYPLKLLDSSTSNDVALTNLYDLQGTSIIVFGVPTRLIVYKCVYIQTSSVYRHWVNIRYKRGSCDHLSRVISHATKRC